MYKTKCVNLWAGPGVGKSTFALGLTYYFKLFGIEAEFIPEYAKEVVRSNALHLFEDQPAIFREQVRRIDTHNSQVELMIIDSPLPLTFYYAKQRCTEEFKKEVIEKFNEFDNHNFFLERNPNYSYDPRGRYQDESGAKIVDNELKELLKENNIPFEIVQVNGDRSVKSLFTDISHKLKLVEYIPDEFYDGRY
jgi:nicotinamide riboside kinase